MHISRVTLVGVTAPVQAAAAGLTMGLTLFPSIAKADTVSVEMAQSKAGCSAPSHIPIIEVAGNKPGKYRRVKTRELWTCLKVRGKKPDYSRNGKGGTIRAESNGRDIDTPNGTDIHGIAFAYVGPLSSGGTYRQNPVQLCNQAIAGLTGGKRQEFLTKGTYITLQNAYNAGATATWEIRKAKNAINPNYYRFNHKKWEGSAKIPALVRCLPTRKPGAGRTGNADPAPSPGRRANPPPRRTNPPPTISNMSLKISPMNIQRVGKWMCPTQLRLSGRIDVIRPFSGNSIFVGPRWLSRKTRIKFQSAKGRYVSGVYTINWSRSGQNSISVGGNKPSRQTLTFKFNVANTAGKLINSAPKTMKVVCKKPKPGQGGQAPGEVTSG